MQEFQLLKTDSTPCSYSSGELANASGSLVMCIKLGIFSSCFYHKVKASINVSLLRLTLASAKLRWLAFILSQPQLYVFTFTFSRSLILWRHYHTEKVGASGKVSAWFSA